MTIHANGFVQHMPGTWGAQRPCSNARVEIFDLDANGSHDSLTAGTTGADGRFRVDSDAKWRDRIKTRVLVPGRLFPPPAQPPSWQEVEVDDPTDVLTFAAKITDGPNQAMVPFLVGPDGQTSPLVVPWAPTPLGKIDGAPVFTGQDLFLALTGKVQTGQNPIRIELFGPEWRAFEPLSRGPTQLRNWVFDQLGLPRPIGGGDALTGAEIAVILGALVAVILAVAVLSAVVLFGIAVIMAIAYGYEAVDWNVQFADNGQPSLTLTLRKRQ